MELSSQEVEIPMPLNSVYGGVHGHDYAHHHHHHHHNYHQQVHPPSSSSTQILSNNPNGSNVKPFTSNINNNNGTDTTVPNMEDKPQKVPYINRDCNPYSNTESTTTTKKLIRYRKCQKNHAASMGGNATDGCEEFMPGGEEGTLEALICSACNCHRNFHRKEVEGDHKYFYLPTPHHHPHHTISTRGRKVILGSASASASASGGGGGQEFLGYPKSVGVGALIPVSRTVPISGPYQVSPIGIPYDQSDDHHDHHYQLVKKRIRTKFSEEQKQKMQEFAEKVGWKIQKQEEGVVQQFCQEVGVKRRVLKVWMHNNKHTSAKKNNPSTNTTIIPTLTN